MSILVTTGRHRRPSLAWRVLTRRISVGSSLNAIGLAAVAGILAGWSVAS